MYSIGEISKLANISIDTLRYYDEIGLLKPHFIEQESRYRYYADEQVSEIFNIMEMKQYGFTLEEVKELIKCNNDGQLLTAYSGQLKKLVGERNKLAKAINLLESRIAELEKKEDSKMNEKTVLIVDDSEFMRMILKDLLGKHSYKVVGETMNGTDAVRLYEELKPSVVLMDIHMSYAREGITAVKEIKAKDSEAVVIMLSALSAMPNVLESIQNGASNFIVKPFSADMLLNIISKTLQEKCYFNNEAILAFQNSVEAAQYANNPMSQESADKLLDICSVKNEFSKIQVTEFLNSFKSVESMVLTNPSKEL